jgi:hypothetical protein
VLRRAEVNSAHCHPNRDDLFRLSSHFRHFVFHLVFLFLGTIKKFHWTLQEHRINLGGWNSVRGQTIMKLAGFLLLFAGWVIVVAAVALLPSPGARVGFLLAGLATELFGLWLAVRSHLVLPAEGE